MEEKMRLLPYVIPRLTVTHFEEGDCISTSGDIDFDSGNENWSENIPGGGWT